MRGAHKVFNVFFVVIFAAECAIKVIAHTFREYIRSSWNKFDFFLVAFSLVATLVVYSFKAMLDPTILRFLRSFRALRILRLSQVWNLHTCRLTNS